MGNGPGLTDAEIRARRNEALAIVQREGVPQIIAKCRSGDPAVMEKAAATLSYCAQRDGQIACNVVACGGLLPLVAMMAAPARAGDDDDEFTMQEVAVRCVFDLCVADASNQRPAAEAGAIPPMLGMLRDGGSPWSIREAATLAVARLAKEASGGPAQEIITEEGGVAILVALHREANCPERAKEGVRYALRALARYAPAEKQMAALGVSQPKGGDMVV